MRQWGDKNGTLLLYDHLNHEIVPADADHRMCPFTLGYCQTIEHIPGICFKEACELWNSEKHRCSLSTARNIYE